MFEAHDDIGGRRDAEQLSLAGIGTGEALLEQGATSGGRAAIEKASGISGTLILKWVNRLDLMRIKGVGSEYSDLLEVAGVDPVAAGELTVVPGAGAV